jgi:tripartite-type tricarboxylate transporter receptor subunit TctC
LSDIPTFAEQGYQGFEAAFWFGLNVPRATPQAVVQRLNKEIVRVMALPDVREKLLSHTIEPTSSSPAAFDVFVRRDIEKWRRVVSAAGIKPE